MTYTIYITGDACHSEAIYPVVIREHINPIYSPRKHTRETYRSQQRKAKQRRKRRK